MAFLRGQPGKENRIGYCHNPNHRGYLSVNLLKNHKCLEKQCRYLEVHKDHPYWVSRKRRRNDKKLREYIRKNNIEGIGEFIARLFYESSSQEMGDTDIREQDDDI